MLYTEHRHLFHSSSGYGLYSDKKYASTDAMAGHESKACPHSNKNREDIFHLQTPSLPCIPTDMFSLGRNMGDEIVPHLNLDSAYRWVGPSTHYLMEPNTENLWRHTVGALENTGAQGRDSFYRVNSHVRSEAWCSSAAMDGRVKAYLQNGNKIHDVETALNDTDSGALGAKYALGDFNGDRPSMFALHRGFDISRNDGDNQNGEKGSLRSTDLRPEDLTYQLDLSFNAQGELIYQLNGSDAADHNVVGGEIKANNEDILELGRTLGEFIKSMKFVKHASDRSSLVLCDPEYLNLAADEKLNSAKHVGPDHNSSEYSRLKDDAVEYIDNELTLLDLTNYDEAAAEASKGGALVEGVFYMEDSSSSTVRIFYPTPMREDAFRPDINGAIVAVRCYAKHNGISYSATFDNVFEQGPLELLLSVSKMIVQTAVICLVILYTDVL